MDAPEPLALTDPESAVLAELSRMEAGSPDQRMTRAYRRMLELVRSSDEFDAILAAHLARDFMAGAPVALGLGTLRRDHFDAGTRVRDAAATWPGDRSATDIPAETIAEVRRLFDEVDAASARATEPARSVFAARDRSAAGYVPDHSVARWREVSERAADLSHRIKSSKALPAVSEGRRVVEELTAALLAGIGPYLTGLGEIDRFLAIPAPRAEDARRLASLLRTPGQLGYFFERANINWLRPLNETGHLVDEAPPVVDAGGGYVRFPTWAAGEYLEKLAAGEPELVCGIVRRTRSRENARTVASIVRIARRLPAEHAATLVPRIVADLRSPLVADFAGIEASHLAQELSEAGRAHEAARLLAATIAATVAMRRESDWYPEQVLGPALEAVSARTPALFDPLGRLLAAALRSDRAMRRYSTIWLRRVDRAPRYGSRREWHLVNALYRVLQAEPLDDARRHVRRLLARPRPIDARIALAAIAARPDLIEDSSEILGSPATWDRSDSTRYEFRRALGSLWRSGSSEAKGRLLAYADSAEEAHAIIREIAERDLRDAPSAEEVVQEWRSRLLNAIRNDISAAWRARLGPLDAIDDDLPEVEAGFVRNARPSAEADLLAMAPTDLLAAVRVFVPPERRGFDEFTLEGLSEVAGRVVAARATEFRAEAAAIVELGPPLTEQVLSGIYRGLRERKIEPKHDAAQLALEVGRRLAARSRPEIWSHETKRNLAGAVSAAANDGLLTASEIDEAAGLVQPLLADPDPSPAAEHRNVAGGYDVGMLALNGVRPEATTAMLELLRAAARLGAVEVTARLASHLRESVRGDRSVSVRAAIGLRLPWLLDDDRAHVESWQEVLFGADTPADARDATWHAYLVYSRWFRDTAIALASQYERAVSALVPRATDDRGSPHDPDELLGVHLGLAYLFQLETDGAETWLPLYYAAVAGWTRARMTRWIAEQAALADATEAVRDRAREFLRQRTKALTRDDDLEELKAVGWIASTTDRPDDVLESIVFPALEKSGGATEDEAGLADLVFRSAASRPRVAARALELLVGGDEWRSLPHIAAEPVRRSLEILRTGDSETRAIVARTVHLLAEQGFLEYRNLRPDSDDGRASA